MNRLQEPEHALPLLAIALPFWVKPNTGAKKPRTDAHRLEPKCAGEARTVEGQFIHESCARPTQTIKDSGG